jgi:hypothetical protein
MFFYGQRKSSATHGASALGDVVIDREWHLGQPSMFADLRVQPPVKSMGSRKPGAARRSATTQRPVSAPPELAGERYEWWDGGVIRRCVRDIQNH